MERQQVPARRLRQVALASYTGSAIEFYDFFIYGTAAALVFPKVFFPNLGTTMATVASLGAFASAFVARPIGGAVFGHFGDRIGRKRTLVVTLMLMGISTLAVGLIPDATTIGIAAPLLLVGLRLLQGFAAGGEWAGSALLSSEYAPPAKRGFYGMFTQLGMGTALLMANLVFLLTYTVLGKTSAAFLTWGWRIPFLLSALLIGTALIIRLRVRETPVFSAARAHDRMPIRALIRRQPLQLVLAGGAVVSIFSLAYMAGTYFSNYAATQLGYSEGVVLLVGVLTGVVSLGVISVSAQLSDRYGRRRIIGLGFALAVPWSLVILPLIDTHSPIVFGATIVITYVIIGISSGPMAAFLPLIFPTRYRYTGTGLAYNLGGIVGGAIPPVISPVLLANDGGWAIGLMMAGMAAVSFISVMFIRESADDLLPTVTCGPRLAVSGYRP